MQDEQFMRQWNEVHERFTADLHDALRRSGRKRMPKRAPAIDSPYGSPEHGNDHPTLSPTALASLRGFAASVITVALWVSVVAIATPASGLA